MAPLRYIFMGSPPIAATILQTLCDKLYPPTLVVSQKSKAVGRGQKVTPTAVTQLAMSIGLNVLESENVNNPAEFDRIRAEKPELILVAAFGQLLKEDMLKAPAKYCLNVHASLLPKYRGAAPIQRAIWEGEKETGITIQKMARKLDTGDILLQKRLPILPEETAGQLTDRLAALGGECLVESLRLIEKGQEQFAVQQEALATYAKKLDKSEAVIHWDDEPERLLNQIRALQPWPVAETTLGGTRLKVFRAERARPLKALAPGEIQTDNHSYLLVGCGAGGAVSLTEIQLENRKKLPVAEFLRAYRGAFPFPKVGS